jgi:tetratricopeptide (TPR) repeat protein
VAKPEYCPVLSTPPAYDEKSRSMKSGMLVKCKGPACALYRKKDDSCALGIADPGSDTTAFATPVEEVDADVEALERMESLVAAVEEGLDARLDELRRDVRHDASRFEEALAEIVRSLNKVSATMDGFTRASRNFERLSEEARKEARSREDREEAWNLFAEGMAHLRAGRTSQGVEALRRCVAKGEAAPPGAGCALGAGLLMGGEVKDAVLHLRRAIRADEASAAPHANLAHALALSQDWESAAESAREAVRLDPRCGAAWNTLGNALFALGRTIEGVEAWRKAVAADPGLGPAWENLKRQGLVSCCEADGPPPA